MTAEKKTTTEQGQLQKKLTAAAMFRPDGEASRELAEDFEKIRARIDRVVRSSIAAGADGLFMEIHPEPEKGLCDAACMFRLSELESVLTDAVNIRKALGKK